MTETVVNTSKGTVRRLRHIAKANGANGELIGRPGYPADEQIRRLTLAHERMDITQEKARITDTFLTKMRQAEERVSAARAALEEAILVVRTRQEQESASAKLAEVEGTAAAQFAQFAQDRGWLTDIETDGDTITVSATPQTEDDESAIAVTVLWVAGQCKGGTRTYADGKVNRNRNASDARKFVEGLL